MGKFLLSIVGVLCLGWGLGSDAQAQTASEDYVLATNIDPRQSEVVLQFVASTEVELLQQSAQLIASKAGLYAVALDEARKQITFRYIYAEVSKQQVIQLLESLPAPLSALAIRKLYSHREG